MLLPTPRRHTHTRTVTWAEEHEPLVRCVRENVRNKKPGANSPFSMDLAILGDELLHWSALTLVYRAIPSPPGSPSTFNPECIHAARQAFASYHKYLDMAGESVAARAGFIRWCVFFFETLGRLALTEPID